MNAIEPKERGHSVRWALRLLGAQFIAAVAFVVTTMIVTKGAFVEALTYGVLGLSLLVVFAGINAAVNEWRAKWLLVSLAGMAIYALVAIYSFTCCARWGS